MTPSLASKTLDRNLEVQLLTQTKLNPRRRKDFRLICVTQIFVLAVDKAGQNSISSYIPIIVRRICHTSIAGNFRIQVKMILTLNYTHNPHADRYFRTVFISSVCSLLNSESLAAEIIINQSDKLSLLTPISFK